jgi:cytochrome b561
MRSTKETYGRGAVWFHWISALLILVMAPVGMIMVDMEDGAAQQLLYRSHTLVGMLVLLITLVRIVWRLREPTPDVPAGITGGHALFYKGVHISLYVIILALTLTGSGMMVLSGQPMPPAPLDVGLFDGLAPQAGHSLLSKVFIALFVAHLGGALLYQFTQGNVLKRMGLNLPIGKA